MKKITDYRKLLGVQKDAELKELKSVYRNLMKDWHPDKFQENEEAKLEAELEFGNQQLSALRLDEMLLTIAGEWDKKGNRLSIFIADQICALKKIKLLKKINKTFEYCKRAAIGCPFCLH